MKLGLIIKFYIVYTYYNIEYIVYYSLQKYVKYIRQNIAYNHVIFVYD